MTIERMASIKDAHQKAQQSYQEYLHWARIAGDALIEQKEECGHGHWGEWQANNLPDLGFGPDTCERYMSIASNWEKVKEEPTVTAVLATIKKEKAKTKKPKSQKQTVTMPTPDLAPWEKVLLAIAEDAGVKSDLVSICNLLAVFLPIDQVKAFLESGEDAA
jgi:hypothetical protein